MVHWTVLLDWSATIRASSNMVYPQTGFDHIPCYFD